MTGQDLIDFIEATGAQDWTVEVQDTDYQLLPVTNIARMDGMIRIYTTDD